MDEKGWRIVGTILDPKNPTDSGLLQGEKASLEECRQYVETFEVRP